MMVMYYSGLISVVSAMIFIILPSLIYKFDKKKKPLSYVGTISKFGYIFNFGAILTGGTQILFMNYLIDTYFNGLLIIGAIVFMFGSVNLILLALITIKRHRKAHTIFAVNYFLFTCLGGLFISFRLLTSGTPIGTTSMTLALATLIGIVLLYLVRKQKTYGEYWAILISSLWVLNFYLN